MGIYNIAQKWQLVYPICIQLFISLNKAKLTNGVELM